MAHISIINIIGLEGKPNEINRKLKILQHVSHSFTPKAVSWSSQKRNWNYDIY